MCYNIGIETKGNIMKILIAIIILISSITTHADEILVGGYVSHILFNSKKIPRNLFRPVLAYKRIENSGDSYFTKSIYAGRDCAKSPILGGMVVKGKQFKFAKIGFAIGGHVHDQKKWKERKVHQPNLGPFVPLVGIDINLEYKRIRLNTLVTPSHALFSLGFSF